MITLKQAALWSGAAVLPEFEHIAFAGSQVDSRVIKPGELFVAIQSNEGASGQSPEKKDGNFYIPAAMERGAAAALGAAQLPGVPMLTAPDSLAAWQRLAAGWRRTLTGTRFIGVTGSVGKTTVKEMTGQICSAMLRSQWTQANYNNEMGVPKTLLDLRPETELAVVEMGMSNRGEISRLTALTRPDVAVINMIGTMHIQQLGSRENICKAKLEILEGLAPDGVAVLNGDEPLLRAAAPGCKTLWFGLGPENDLRAEELRYTPSGIAFTAAGLGCRVPVELPVPGLHDAANALAAMLAAHCAGVPLRVAAEALRNFKNTGHRMAIQLKNGFTVLADCYNAGRESTAAALRVLRDRPARGRRIAVLGDMLELGAFSRDFHREIGECAARCADLVLAFGPESRALAEAAGGKARWFADRDALLEALRQQARPGDSVLFKASHGMHLEAVMDAFLA